MTEHGGLGPNPHQEFINGEVSDLDHLPMWRDFQDDHGKGTFCLVPSEALLLSMSCNWCFVNLNRAFRSLVGVSSLTLHVYSHVGGSSIVGNQVTDLMREVQNKREGKGTVYFEPLHVQYIPPAKRSHRSGGNTSL